MNFEELHNELNDFPDDLKYDDQHWEKALALIEANESFVKRKKGVFFSSIGALIIVALFFGNSTNEYAEYQPRKRSVIAFNHSEPDNLKGEKEISELAVLAPEKIVSVDQKISTHEAEPKENSAQRNPVSKSQSTSNDHASQKVESSEFSTGEKIYEERIQNEVITLITETEPKLKKETLELETPLAVTKNIDHPSMILNPEEEFPHLKLGYTENILIDDRTFRPLALKTKFLTKSFNGTSGLRNTNKILLGKSFVRYFKFLEAKVGVNPWADFGRKDLLGNYNPIVGLTYEAPLSEKLTWNVGAEYMNISGIDLSVSSENTSYRFGRESQITTVYTDKAHFVNVPLGIAVNVLPRVQLKSGISTSVLIQTANTLEQRKQTHQTDEVLSEDKTEGYTSSLNTMQVSVSIGARYWLSGRNALQINFHKGLTDFSKNDVFHSENVDLTSRLEISINRVIR